MITVYIDVLFAVNFIINILIVEACSVLAVEETKWYRTLLSAFIGAMYAVLIFFPNFRFALTVVMKLCVSGIMVRCAFRIRSWRHFFRLSGCFYLTSFIFGGGISVLLSFTGLGAKTGAVFSNGTVYFNLPWGMLFLSGATVYFMIYAFGRMRKKRIVKESIGRSLAIYINGQKIETKAIIDTGNNLFDPITGDPVIVCEYSAVEKAIPKKGKDVIESMQAAGVRIRLIPFTSIGKDKGLMPAFCPDKVEIDSYDAKRCIVGISETKISQREDYHALLNPMLTLVNSSIN